MAGTAEPQSFCDICFRWGSANVVEPHHALTGI
jgi:hypothetical protein